ncbi:MAG: hypothetical protein DME09_19950 [Candidatus Rokuibacteriota bacterium]|nr:MAG: hypothetical protein DME09_19950 [Candidatus Rokubacteria bacterium]
MWSGHARGQRRVGAQGGIVRLRFRCRLAVVPPHRPRPGPIYAEAEPLYRRALAIQERALSREHPDVAAC